MCNQKTISFSSIGIWISSILFITETIADILVVVYYFHENLPIWGYITVGILVVPMILCQIYSLALILADQELSYAVVFLHCCLLGIPYRYEEILRTIDKDKMSSHERESNDAKIKDVNSIQVFNAIVKNLPQFIFQTFLIAFRRYRTILTGISAGLAGFAFVWHIVIYFYYWSNRNEDCGFTRRAVTDLNTRSLSRTVIDNISSSSFINDNQSRLSATAVSATSQPPAEVVSITESLKTFEKELYKTDDKNFLPKRACLKTVEKSGLFGFDKRKPIYENEIFDLYDAENRSSAFFELNANVTGHSQTNLPLLKIGPTVFPSDELLYSGDASTSFTLTNREDRRKLQLPFEMLQKPSLAYDNGGGICGGHNPEDFRNLMLKRKGICSSREMIHLVDILNDNIPAEHVDALAKSLIELNGDCDFRSTNSPINNNNNNNNNKNNTDGSGSGSYAKVSPNAATTQQASTILENIDAALYENQIIFQERIRKNQLTIQNLKLQDQILSSFIDVPDLRSIPYHEILSTRDYENMCFININRQNRGLKHWRNYLRDIDNNQHDNSTVLNSSCFYVNTNTETDLYLNDTDTLDDIKSMDRYDFYCMHENVPPPPSSSSPPPPPPTVATATVAVAAAAQKNMLVETINKINVDSPLKTQNLMQTNTLNNNINININNSNSFSNNKTEMYPFKSSTATKTYTTSLLSADQN